MSLHLQQNPTFECSHIGRSTAARELDNMLNWIAKNTGTLQVAISSLTGIVWLAYLHILWLNFRRQRQAVILINRSVAQDENAHCFVTNMGAEPIYLMEVMARVVTDEKTYTVKVTEREEVAERVGQSTNPH